MNRQQSLVALRDAIQDDVGQRGLARDPQTNLFNACPDDLASACRSIADHPAPLVGVVTGFYIPTAGRGETDGPLGAIYLWRTLSSLGIRVVLLTDPFCSAALLAGQESSGLDASPHGILGLDGTSSPAFTHLIALERVGPSHTEESIRAQPGSSQETVATFLAEVPEALRGRCYTMRARDITQHMLPAERLFEAPTRQAAVTIGIGDGGNEIGMGKVPWTIIRRNIPQGSIIACRVPTDHLIVAGISNWGAYALAVGVALERGIRPDADWFDVARERAILAGMVERGSLVDGVTGQPVPRVDGLPFEEYARVLERLGAIARG